MDRNLRDRQRQAEQDPDDEVSRQAYRVVNARCTPSSKDVEYLQEYLGLCEKMLNREIDASDGIEKLSDLNSRYPDYELSPNIKRDILLGIHFVNAENSWSSSQDDCPWD